MKVLTTLITVLFFMSTSSAQETTLKGSAKDRYKQISGRYGGNDGICLFEDGQFMLYGYATAVFGYYVFEKDYLLFYPNQSELFEVYASRNKSIGDSSQFNFVGFERGGKTLIRLGNDAVKPVFNDNANCFDGPFVYALPKKIQGFGLYGQEQDAENLSTGNAGNVFFYRNDLSYNDFILVYNAPKREYENFSAMLSKTGTTSRIKLSNFGNGDGYVKRDQDEEWKDILAMRKEYEQSKTQIKNGVFANKHYKTFPLELEDYYFDTRSGQYISKRAAGNEAYFLSNPYSDNRYLRKFVKLDKQQMTRISLPLKETSVNSIFFTVCGEGAEKSYHYKGILKPQNDGGNLTVPTTVPSPIPPKKL